MKTVEAAELAALKGRTNSKDGRKWLSCKTENRRTLIVDAQQLTLNPEYRQLEKTNNNGKVRQIDAPTLKTLVMQHLWIELVMPFYKDAEPGVARNCLEGRGVTSDKRDGSILKEAKRLFYDRRDLNFLACADQRQCYQRLTVKAYRHGMKALRNIVLSKTRPEKASETIAFWRWLIDLGEHVSFVDGRLPIGTPTSPLVHHIAMQPFDRAIVLLWLENLSYEEIGQIVGISTKNVSVRLFRIREQLKQMSND